jgi:hypothetical protein
VDAFIKLMLSLKTLRLSPQRVKPTLRHAPRRSIENDGNKKSRSRIQGGV